MKHIVTLKIKTGTKMFYQIVMILGLVLICSGTILAFFETPLIVLAILGVPLFLVSYYTLKEVYANEVKLIVEATGDELKVYRENSDGYQAVKTVVRASELASIKIFRIDGSFGLTYYSISAKTTAKSFRNHKLMKLLSPVLETNESELTNILYVIQKQYPFIQVGGH